MLWHQTNRVDPCAAALADRHYSRQSHGSLHFTPPGRVFCLITEARNAVWATSWPFPQFVHRAYPDAWCCSLFRNEGPHKASDLIVDAIAATRWYYGDAPSEGMVTMIDRAKVKPTMVRGHRTWGYTYKLAGFQEVGETKGGLLILQLRREQMPAPIKPHGASIRHLAGEKRGVQLSLLRDAEVVA